MWLGMPGPLLYEEAKLTLKLHMCLGFGPWCSLFHTGPISRDLSVAGQEV